MKLTDKQKKELYEFGRDIWGEGEERMISQGQVDIDRMLAFMEEDMDDPIVTEQLSEVQMRAIRDECEALVDAGIERQKFLIAVDDIMPDLTALLDYVEPDEKKHYEESDTAHGKSDHIYLVIKRLRDKLKG